MGNSKTKLAPSNPKDIETNCPSHPSTSQLQVRNCVRNVRNINNANFAEMYPDNAYGGPGAPPIYTIDLNSNSTPSNYTNAAYVITENPKTSHSSDGLPTYEEAMSGVRNPMAQSGGSQPQSQPQPQAPSTTIPIEMPADEAVTTTGKRGRRHHHHRHHQRHNRRPRCDGASPADSAPAINQPSTTLNAVCENGDDATHGRRARRSNYRHLRNHRRHHRNNPQNPQE